MGRETPKTEYSVDEAETYGVIWDKMEGLLDCIVSVDNNRVLHKIYWLEITVLVYLQRIKDKSLLIPFVSISTNQSH